MCIIELVRKGEIDLNKYYLLVCSLYDKSYKKFSLQDYWGDIYGKVRFAMIGTTVSAIVMAFLIIKLLLSDVPSIDLYFALSYFSMLGFLIRLIRLSKKRKVPSDIKQREEWLESIEKFDTYLTDYEFNKEDLERMVNYIVEYCATRTKRKQRKYDVIWGVMSVTIFSLIISIGKSIWDSFGFEKAEALGNGILVITLIIIFSSMFLFLASTAYDSIALKETKEEKVKLALEEVIFNRHVKLIVTKDEINKVLIEDFVIT